MISRPGRCWCSLCEPVTCVWPLSWSGEFPAGDGRVAAVSLFGYQAGNRVWPALHRTGLMSFIRASAWFRSKDGAYVGYFYGKRLATNGRESIHGFASGAVTFFTSIPDSWLVSSWVHKQLIHFESQRFETMFRRKSVSRCRLQHESRLFYCKVSSRAAGS